MSEEIEDQEFEIEMIGPSEYIASAFYALSAVEDIDLEILPGAQATRVKRIRARSIRIIDHCINELYTDLFDDEN